MLNSKNREWGIKSSDGQFYRVGRYKDGEWYPGSFWKALREWFLLREFGSYIKFVHQDNSTNKEQL